MTSQSHSGDRLERASDMEYPNWVYWAIMGALATVAIAAITITALLWHAVSGITKRTPGSRY